MVSSSASSLTAGHEPCRPATEPGRRTWQRANGFRGRQLRGGAPLGGVTNRDAPLKVSSGAAAARARDDRQPTAKTAARSGANRAQRGGRSERLVARGEEFTVTAHNVPGISDYVGDWAACKEPGTTGFKFGSDFSIFTECHGAQVKKRGQRGWVCSQDCPDGDSAAGVCIRLSDRAWASRVLGQEGSGPQRSGHRMVWVRVHAQPRDVVVVGVYAPHFKRHGPTQKQFLEDLRELLMQFPEGMQVIVAGDFNCRLARDQRGITGRWSIHNQYRHLA